MIEANVPPNEKGIEVSVLGAMLIDNNILPFAINSLSVDMFYQGEHRKVFKAIQQLSDASKPVDIETITYQLKSNGVLEQVGGPSYIAGLINKIQSTAHINAHIAILKECYIKRRAIDIAVKLINDSYESSTDAFDIISEANNKSLEVLESVLKGSQKEMLHYVLKVAEKRDRVIETGTIGLTTGFKGLDHLIGGWASPDLIIIAARPGMGKTAMMLSSIHNLSVVQNIPGAVFSLEMSGEQLTERLEAIDSGIYHRKLRHNTLSDYDRKLLTTTENKVSKAPLYIEDRPAITIRDVRAKANVLKRKHGIKYIAIDYLQLMKGFDEKGKSREQVISEISRGCKEIAKELDLPVIALSQLSRAVESRADKIPQLSDLRESGSIEQDADEVIFLMRPEYYGFVEAISFNNVEYSANGLVICKIDKNRHGKTGTLPLRFEKELMKYCDYEKDLSF
jgi:replicative DNA helicase